MSATSQTRRHPWLAAADLVSLLVVVALWLGALPARYPLFDVPLGIFSGTYVVSILALLHGGPRGARLAGWSALLRMVGGLAFVVLLAASAADVTGRFGPVGAVGAGFMFFGMALLVPYLLVFPALEVAYLTSQHRPSADGRVRFGRRLRRLLFASLGLVATSFVASRAFAIGQVASAPTDGVMRTAFASLRGEGESREHRAAGPIIVELIDQGRVRGRFVGTTSLRETVRDARVRFRMPRLIAGSWVISVPTRRSRPAPWPWLDLFQVAPLHDGVLVRLGGQMSVATPTTLQLLGAHQAVSFAPMPFFQFGTDLGEVVGRVQRLLPRRAGDRPEVELLRFATFTDPPYQDAARRRPLPQASEEVVRAAVLDNVDFLLRHQREDGLFGYQVDATRGWVSSDAYDITRHAGVAYFLAQAGHQLGLKRATDGARQGIRFVLPRVRPCGPQAARCVVIDNRHEFGATALLAVALYDLRSVTDTEELSLLHRDLLTFLLQQQRADGEMMHGFDLERGTPVDVQQLYWSGEAALALVRGAALEHDVRVRRAAGRLLQYLSVDSRDALAEPYLMGEDHWTCIAYGELRSLLGEDPPGVRDFCERWAAFSRRVQLEPGDTVWDVTGAYALGPVIPPQVTATSSRTEAFAAMLAGTPERHESELFRQVERGVQALLQHQFRPGPTHLMRQPEAMRGGVTGSPGDLVVRNDYVQHAGSAYLRYLALLAGRP